MAKFLLMLPARSAPALFWVIVVLLGCANVVLAQQTAVSTLAADGDGVTLEMRASWGVSLRQTVDSLGIAVFDEQTASAATGGWLTTSEEVVLPVLASPLVRVTASDYEELRLALTDDVDASLDEFLDMLARPAAFNGGIGTSRGSALASVAFQPLSYDPETETLRRYRRIVARVDFAPASQRVQEMRMLAAGNPHLEVSQSVLADGTVIKIPILEEGVYRIDHGLLEELASDAGIPISSIRPDEIKLYGNGGAPLPAIAGEPRPADLIENPILVQGGGDGSFDTSDAIIFYARGPSGWSYEPDDGWAHFQNPFSNENYVFLKLGGSRGQRLDTAPFPGFASPHVLERVEGRLFIQPDEHMWAKDGGSGLTWVSRPIQANGELRILDNHAAPGLASGTIRYESAVAIRSNPRTAVRFFDGGSNVGRILANRSIGSGSYTPVASYSTGTFEQNGSGGSMNLSMRLESATNAPAAALIWLRAFYPQNLSATGGYLRFASPEGESGNLEFRLSGFTQTPVVWEVSDGRAVRSLSTESAGGAVRIQTSVDAVSGPREFVAFSSDGARPLSDALDEWGMAPDRIAPQNLHGVGGFPEFVIITPQEFQSAAERLADHRRAEGLDVRVIDIQQIYNEFSGGHQDMRAVRDYLKFLYDRGPSAEPALRYALLFGDGHFNFRNIREPDTPASLENWIPSYQTDETFDPIRSFTSDDYFALLDDHEGAWPYPGEQSHAPPGGVVERVDLGIGRFTVQTPAEADVVVNKIIEYDHPSTHGSWRGRYTFLADDEYNGLSAQENDFDLHTQNADAVAELVEEEAPRMNIKKIYAQSYQREFLGGWRIPTAKRDVLTTLNEGTLVFNFSGHGNTETLMQEEVFTRADVARLTNRDRQAIFITATCDFGRWDLQDRQSTAEDLLHHEGGGTVALFTTVRVVYTSASIHTLNVGLNRELNRAMFQRDDDGRPRRLGDILWLTKNTDAGLQGNNRKFNLLGDPTMRVGMPSQEIAIDEVNGVNLNDDMAPLRALDRVNVRGSVRSEGGSVDSGFSGAVELTVFDAQREVPVPNRQRMPRPYYTVREDLIWRGTANVEDGRFEADFVVPKDISYRDEPGRISAYAQSGEGQALGFTHDVVVGGTADNPGDDDVGPEIRLFLNDTTFVSGGLTTPDPVLIVKLFDESGINTVGAGVGHEMMLMFNENQQDVVDLSRYYESEPGSYQRGTVTYPIEQDLSAGSNSLSVRAWDVLNNSSTEQLDFYVGESESLALRNVFNYPNPTSGRTRFVFEHNQPVGTPASVQLRVYTINGRPVRTIESDESLPGGMLTGSIIQIPWDGRDGDFGVLASGVYLYRLRVETEGADGEKQVSEHIDRIAIIR